MFSLELKYNPKHLATYILTAVTSLYWLVQVFTYGFAVGTGQNIYNAGAIWGWAILGDPTQLWRLITPIFVHLSWPHILVNMFSLFFIGRIIEEIFGSFRFAAIYLLSGIFANAAIFCLNTNSLSAGASTSIFGIFGAIATLGFFTGDPRLKTIGQSFLTLIIVNLVLGLFQANISIVGHVGGVFGGALLAAIIPPKAYAPWIPTRYRILATLLFVIAFCLFITLPFIFNGTFTKI